MLLVFGDDDIYVLYWSYISDFDLHQCIVMPWESHFDLHKFIL
jgi:hypothetical protein